MRSLSMDKWDLKRRPEVGRNGSLKRRKQSHEMPSANALRERVRARDMKLAYLALQKTLPNVPPDTKLARINILLLAIDYISYLRSLLTQENHGDFHESELVQRDDRLRPFIKVWSYWLRFSRLFMCLFVVFTALSRSTTLLTLSVPQAANLTSKPKTYKL